SSGLGTLTSSRSTSRPALRGATCCRSSKGTAMRGAEPVGTSSADGSCPCCTSVGTAVVSSSPTEHTSRPSSAFTNRLLPWFSPPTTTTRSRGSVTFVRAAVSRSVRSLRPALRERAITESIRSRSARRLEGSDGCCVSGECCMGCVDSPSVGAGSGHYVPEPAPLRSGQQSVEIGGVATGAERGVATGSGEQTTTETGGRGEAALAEQTCSSRGGAEDVLADRRPTLRTTRQSRPHLRGQLGAEVGCALQAAGDTEVDCSARICCTTEIERVLEV